MIVLGMDEIRSFLAGIFNSDDTNRLVQQLQELGAESMNDVKLLDVDKDIGDTVPVLKRRRLSDSIAKLYNETVGKLHWQCLYTVV